MQIEVRDKTEIVVKKLRTFQEHSSQGLKLNFKADTCTILNIFNQLFTSLPLIASK